MAIFNNERIYSLLLQYNPWWQAEKTREAPPPVKRQAYYDVLHTITNPQIRRFAVLSGARRVGKTTVLKQTIEELLRQGTPPMNILYLSFDNPIFKLSGFDQIISVYDQMFPHEGTCYFLLDEIQYAESWSLWVKTLYDTRPGLQLVATGSASPAIEKGAADSGVGRWRVFRMPTMTFHEYCDMQDISAGLHRSVVLQDIPALPEAEFTAIMTRFSGLMPHWNHYLLIGGFPELVKMQDAAEAQRILREDVVDKVLKRDVPSLFDVRNSAQLEKIFLYLCLHTGNLANYTSISNELDGVSKPTLARYIEYLQDANLIYISQASGIGKKRGLSSQPKIYVADAALRNACLMINDPLSHETDLGIMVETAVYKHFFTAYASSARVGYARLPQKGDREADVVVDFPNQERILCEVKYRNSSSVSGKDAISVLRSESRTKAAFIATKSPTDFGVSRAAGQAPLIRMPAPALCYLLSSF